MNPEPRAVAGLLQVAVQVKDRHLVQHDLRVADLRQRDKYKCWHLFMLGIFGG